MEAPWPVRAASCRARAESVSCTRSSVAVALPAASLPLVPLVFCVELLPWPLGAWGSLGKPLLEMVVFMGSVSLCGFGPVTVRIGRTAANFSVPCCQRLWQGEHLARGGDHGVHHLARTAVAHAQARAAVAAAQCDTAGAYLDAIQARHQLDLIACLHGGASAQGVRSQHVACC